MEIPFRSFGRRVGVALALLACQPAWSGTLLDNGFKQDAAGLFDFNDPNNWLSETIDGLFAQTPAGLQIVTFSADTIAPAGGLTFNLGGSGGLMTLRGTGGNRTLTLQSGDGVSVNSSGGSAVTFGSLSTGEGLQLVLASGAHPFDVGGDDLLKLLNGTSGVGRLEKTGNGTMVVTGAADHTGGTSVAGGTLQVGDGTIATTLAGDLEIGAGAAVAVKAANALSSTGAVIVAADHSESRGVLQIFEDQMIASLTSAGESIWDAEVEIADGKVLTIDAPFGEPSEFAGVISGAAGKLVKTGEGGQILSGANSFGGGTEVREGFLQIGGYWGDGVLAGDVMISTGAELVFSPSDAGFYSGAISGAGVLSVGRNQLVLDGENGGFTGRVEIEDGAELSLRTSNVLGTQAAVWLGEGAYLGLRADQTIASLEGGAGAEVRFEDDGVPTFVPTWRVLTVDGSADTTFGGTITGDGALVKAGTGRLTLTNASDYTGGTTIDGGVLVVENASGSATGTGAIAIGAAGELQLGNGSTSSGGVIGPIANDGRVTFNASGGLFSGEISGVGRVTIASFGEVTFSGESSYTGGTSVEAGAKLILANPVGSTLAAGGDVTLGDGSILRVDSNQTIRGLESSFASSAVEIAGGKTLTVNLPTSGTSAFSGEIRGSAGAVLKKDGPGTLYFYGTANPDYEDEESGGYRQTPLLAWVAAGTLHIGDGGQNGVFLGPITVDAPGTVVVNREDNNTFPFTFAGTGAVVKEGTSNITLTGANTFTGTLTINDGTITVGADSAAAAGVKVVVNAGGAFAVGSGVTSGITVASLTGAGATTIAGGKKLTVNVAAPQSYAGEISGAGAFRKSGTATYTLSGSSSYSGDTWVESGTLVGSAGALSASSIFRVNGGATLQVNASNTIGGLDDYLPNVSGLVSVDEGAVLTVDNGISNTFSGTLSGAGGLKKRGAGTLTLAGSSTLAGSARIEQGTLVVGAPVAFTAGSVLVETGATFDVANSTSVASLSGAGATLVRTGAVLTLSAPGTLASAITGTGGVTFQNANQSTGETVVSRTQTFTGPTTLTVGTLRFTGSSGVSGENIYGSNIAAGAGTTIEFGRSDSLYGYSGSISGGGSVVKTGGGKLVLSGMNSYTGNTTVSGGTLKAAATNTLPSTTRVAVANGATLQVAASQTINGFVSGGGFLGSIVVEAEQVLNVALGSSTLGTDFGGVISGDGGLRIGPSSNGRVVMLTGDNTYTGGTTIDVGGGLLLGDGISSGGRIVGNVVNNGTLTFQPADDTVFGGVISGTGAVYHGVGAGGPELGETRLTAANTYAGGTRVYGGVLFAVNASGSATGSGLVQVLNGGILAGTGTVAGPLIVDFGGIVAPASDLGAPGTLKVGPTTFGGDGEFLFQITDAEGTAGTDYSLLAISGQLAISATGTERFAIQMYSVGLDGGVANFDAGKAYSWMFVTTTGGVTGFDATKFDFDLENFSVSLTGAFSVSQVENNLLINYSPAAVPEPSTWVLLGGGLAVVALTLRRRSGRR